MINAILQIIISPAGVFIIIALAGLGWMHAHNLYLELQRKESENEDLKRRLGRI